MRRAATAFLLSTFLLVLIHSVRLGYTPSIWFASSLTVLVLWCLAEQSTSSQRRRIGVLTLVYWGISSLNTLVEAVLFQVMPIGTALRTLAWGLLTAGLVSVLFVGLQKQRTLVSTPSSSAPVRTRWGGRIPLLALCYCALYVMAGIAVYPWVHAYYAGRRLPSVVELLAVQWVRGSVYGLLLGLWLQIAHGTRLRLSLTLALSLSVLGGIAPLLLAGSYMPTAVRWAHAAEVGVSNFLFGLVLGYGLLGRNEPPQHSHVSVEETCSEKRAPSAKTIA